LAEDFKVVKEEFQKYFDSKKAFFNESQKVTIASSLL